MLLAPNQWQWYLRAIFHHSCACAFVRLCAYEGSLVNWHTLQDVASIYLRTTLSGLARRVLPEFDVLTNQQLAQRHLLLHYQHMRATGGPLPAFDETGFRIFSQDDEDGRLLYLFALLGTTNKVCVDIAFRTIHGANTTNLILNHGWSGLLVDANPHAVRQSRRFFASHRDTALHPPRVVHAWVTAENINQLLTQHGMQGEIDLFSLDVDGIDYWLWHSLEVIQPRVVVVEFLNLWEADQAVTVPYRADFQQPATPPGYGSASLAAFVKLGQDRGYRLVGCNRFRYNAFFVRADLGAALLPAIDPATCLTHPQAIAGRQQRLAALRRLPWVEV
jgi:hypothetical protein